tara:strand:- start:525 stop:3083 length:2559 start_codon:yes stop_codon:yes gene_type:complete
MLDFGLVSKNLANIFSSSASINIGGKSIGTLRIGDPIILKRGVTMIGWFPLYWKLELGFEVSLELGTGITGDIGFGSSGSYESEMGMMYCAPGFQDKDCSSSSNGLTPINKLKINLPNFENVGKGLELGDGSNGEQNLVVRPKLIPTFVFTLTLYEMFSFILKVHLTVAVELMNSNTDKVPPAADSLADSPLGYWKFNIRSFKNAGNHYSDWPSDSPIYPGFRIETRVPKDVNDPRIGTDLDGKVEYVAKKWQSGCMHKKVGDKDYGIEYLGNQAVLQGPIDSANYQFKTLEECPLNDASTGIYCPKYIGFDYATTATSTQEKRCKECGTSFNDHPFGFQDILVGPTQRSRHPYDVDFLYFQDCRPNHWSDTETGKYTWSLERDMDRDSGTDFLTTPWASEDSDLNRCPDTITDLPGSSWHCVDDCCSTGAKPIKTELRIDYEWIPMSKMEKESSATLGSTADMADFNTVSDLKSLNCGTEEYSYRTSLQIGVSLGFEGGILTLVAGMKYGGRSIGDDVEYLESFLGSPLLGFQFYTSIIPVTNKMVLPFLTGCFNPSKFDEGWIKAFRMFMCPKSGRRRLGNGYCVMDPSAGLQLVHYRESNLWQQFFNKLHTTTFASANSEKIGPCHESQYGPKPRHAGATYVPTNPHCSSFDLYSWDMVEKQGYYLPTTDWFFESFNGQSDRNRCIFRIVGETHLDLPVIKEKADGSEDSDDSAPDDNDGARLRRSLFSVDKSLLMAIPCMTDEAADKVMEAYVSIKELQAVASDPNANAVQNLAEKIADAIGIGDCKTMYPNGRVRGQPPCLPIAKVEKILNILNGPLGKLKLSGSGMLAPITWTFFDEEFPPIPVSE